MTQYRFRSRYYTNTGVDVSTQDHTKYYVSPVNTNGNGSISNPYNTLRPLNAPYQGSLKVIEILANGMYRNIPLSHNAGSRNTSLTYLMIGQSKTSTVLSPVLTIAVPGLYSSYSSVFKDVCFSEWTINQGGGGNADFAFYSCWIKSAPKIVSGTQPYKCTLCLLEIPNTSIGLTDQGQNSYLNAEITNVINSLAVYENCNVTIDSQAKLTSYISRYAAFDSCKFKFGNESTWTALNGTTEKDCRADFVSRCVAQGWTVPTGTEYADTDMPMFRWVFSNGSSKAGVPVIDGIIHNFEKRRFITFGYETKREGFGISTDKTQKDSFNSSNPNSGFQFSSNALSFPATTDITNRITNYATSGIKWLGGKVKITDLSVIHNMPVEYGVMVDNTSTIDFTAITSGNIVADQLYIVRSTDKNYAAITYNGVGYNTALSNNLQVFKGVSGQTGFTVVSGNPVIYKLSDYVQHQTIEVRIVNKIPTGNINAGTALTTGYWYLVEHDTDQSNTSDYITYKGSNYKVGSSFLASDTSTFTKSGSIHLRRCWKDAFDYDTESLDKVFWQNEQKPKWCKIVLGDTPRCIMTANSNKQNEMKSDSDGNYITTGNPEFYDYESGDGGIAVPTFPIQGTYMQIRLTVTTVNPM